jgi:uncharacterized transporter YbjL
MQQLELFLHESPGLCLFLSILLGTIIGRFHVKGVGFGSVVGTLLAGMAIGILAKPEIPELLRWTFFYLFLFSIGYSVGPQFFGSLKKEALPQIALALVVSVTGLVTVVGCAAVFGFDEGIAVGVLSGGMTQSAALGTGVSAIAELPIPDEAKATLMANAPLGDAITYGFGDFGGSQKRGQGAGIDARRRHRRPNVLRHALQRAGSPRRERGRRRLQRRSTGEPMGRCEALRAASAS